MNKIAERIYDTVRYNLGFIPEKEFYIEAFIERGNLEAVKKLFEKNPDLKNIRNAWKETLLHVAVHQKQKEIVDFLIAVGCDVNAKDDNGQTPLHVAALFPSKRIVESLIRNGADPNIIDDEGSAASDLV